MAFEKHLLIDAANIIHAWPDLRSMMKQGRDTARGHLIRQLAAIHDSEAIRVTVVVDGRGSEIVVEHPTKQDTFTVVYTPSSLTADDVIEKMIGRSADAGLCEVATGDQAERATIEACGAVWVPAADLAARLDRAERRLSSKVAALNKCSAEEWRRR